MDAHQWQRDHEVSCGLSQRPWGWQCLWSERQLQELLVGKGCLSAGHLGTWAGGMGTGGHAGHAVIGVSREEGPRREAELHPEQPEVLSWALVSGLGECGWAGGEVSGSLGGGAGGVLLRVLVVRSLMSLTCF